MFLFAINIRDRKKGEGLLLSMAIGFAFKVRFFAPLSL